MFPPTYPMLPASVYLTLCLCTSSLDTCSHLLQEETISSPVAFCSDDGRVLLGHSLYSKAAFIRFVFFYATAICFIRTLRQKGFFNTIIRGPQPLVQGQVLVRRSFCTRRQWDTVKKCSSVLLIYFIQKISFY